MRARVLAAVSMAALTVGLTLTGCGYNPADYNTNPPVASIPDPAAGDAPMESYPEPTEPTYTVRTVVPGEVFPVETYTNEYAGATAVVGNAEIVSVKIDPKCTEDTSYMSKDMTEPKNGHYVRAEVKFETAPTYDPSKMFGGLSTHQFSITGPDGYTHTNVTASSYGCFDDNAPMSSSLMPNSRYHYWVTLDSPVASGTLNVTPSVFSTFQITL